MADFHRALPSGGIDVVVLRKQGAVRPLISTLVTGRGAQSEPELVHQRVVDGRRGLVVLAG